MSTGEPAAARDRRATRIAVIGGGFSGAAFAIHLSRAAAAPFEITVIEPRAGTGLGLAYDTADPAHRLNIPAPVGTLFPEDPLHLENWLRGSGALGADPEMAAPRGLFPLRATYGAYVAEHLGGAGAVRHAADTARSLTRQDGHWRIGLGGGAAIETDIVVLATGHPPPAVPAAVATALGGDQRLVTDPWAPDALAGVGPDEDVLVLGTGLTMADIVASLEVRGHRGRITAVSRRGLLPRPNPRQAVAAWGGFGPSPPRTVLGLLRRVRAAVREAEAAGQPWQAVAMGLHRDGQAIWTALPLREQRRFLRHLVPFYTVHRFRLGPQVEDAVRRARSEGRLEVIAGSVRNVRSVDAGILVELTPRRAPTGTVLTLEASRMVIATGPALDSTIRSNPVLAGASASGLIRSDPLGLGIDVDGHSRALDGRGRVQETMFVIGPPARGVWGELVGVPEILGQVKAVVTHILDRFQASSCPTDY